MSEIMDKKHIPKIFVEYAKRKGFYDSWLEQARRKVGSPSISLFRILSIIPFSFEWGRSKEGYDYWADITTEWKQYLTESTIHPYIYKNFPIIDKVDFTDTDFYCLNKNIMLSKDDVVRVDGKILLSKENKYMLSFAHSDFVYKLRYKMLNDENHSISPFYNKVFSAESLKTIRESYAGKKE